MTENAWDKLPQESTLAYQTFTEYLNMGIGRAYTKLCVKLGRKPSYVKLIAVWASKYAWQNRLEAYLRWQQEEKEKAYVRELEEMNKSHIAQVRLLQQKGALRLKDMMPEDLSPSDAQKFVTEGIKMERVIKGVEDSHAKVDLNGKVDVSVRSALKLLEDE